MSTLENKKWWQKNADKKMHDLVRVIQVIDYM